LYENAAQVSLAIANVCFRDGNGLVELRMVRQLL